MVFATGVDVGVMQILRDFISGPDETYLMGLFVALSPKP